MLIRSTFEARLRQHFRQDQYSQTEDPSWFALRNTVYATGCRCLLANSTSLTFEEVENKAWQLFCNALSVFGGMIFSHSGLTAIQALTLMVGCLLTIDQQSDHSDFRNRPFMLWVWQVPALNIPCAKMPYN